MLPEGRQSEIVIKSRGSRDQTTTSKQGGPAKSSFLASSSGHLQGRLSDSLNSNRERQHPRTMRNPGETGGTFFLWPYDNCIFWERKVIKILHTQLYYGTWACSYVVSKFYEKECAVKCILHYDIFLICFIFLSLREWPAIWKL